MREAGGERKQLEANLKSLVLGSVLIYARQSPSSDHLVTRGSTTSLPNQTPQLLKMQQLPLRNQVDLSPLVCPATVRVQ